MIGGPVLCAGNIVSDVLVRPVSELVFNTTRWVDSITQEIGGNGANTSYTLARLGVPVQLHSVLGTDSIGATLRQKLDAAGVDTSGVLSISGASASTVALVRPDGARMFLHQPGVNREDAEEFGPDFGELGSTRAHFHLANCFSMAALRSRAASLLEEATKAGLTTSFDAGWDGLGEWMKVTDPCMPYIGLLFTNVEESFQLTGLSDEAEAAKRLLDLGAKTIVMKRGAEGCRIYRPDSVLESPAFLVNAVDSTGAGDCFAGAFLAALSREHTLEDAARFANAVGALNVEKMGATTGVTSYEATLEWMSAQVTE